MMIQENLGELAQTLGLSPEEQAFLQRGQGPGLPEVEEPNIRYHGGMMGGLKHGIGTRRYENGNLHYTGIWVHDQMDGKNIQIFHDNKFVKFNGSLEKGKRVGVCETFDESRNRIECGNYVNDVINDGQCMILEANGSRWSGPIVNGKKSGNLAVQV